MCCRHDMHCDEPLRMQHSTLTHLPSGLADFDSTSSFLSTSLGSVFFLPLDATNSLIFLSSISSVMFSSTCHDATFLTSVSVFDLVIERARQGCRVSTHVLIALCTPTLRILISTTYFFLSDLSVLRFFSSFLAASSRGSFAVTAFFSHFALPFNSGRPSPSDERIKLQ